MLKKANATKYYSYQREEGQNTNTGFMSFQGFRGEPLYSDCIVRPENKFTETEHYECYPRPSYIEEKGDEQGYYPDTSIVYIRILWKEWERDRGVYNYDFIQGIIDKAKEHGQTLLLRLMAHSTRECDDVPEWLKTLVDCPKRPAGERVKDSPTDPLFIELFVEAIKALGERFDKDPILETVDISLPGAWGEGHNLHLYSNKDLEKLFDAYTDTFKNTRLIGQIARPELIMRASEKCSVGARGDGFGSPQHIYEEYPPLFEQIEDLWKTAPISFEAYWWLGEWKRQGWDIDEIIQLTLKWHASSFNGKSLPIPFEWREKVDAWVAQMGYHLQIDYFKYPDEASVGDEIEIKLGIENRGVAPMYDKVPLYLRLNGDKSYEFKTDIDVTKWLPGKHSERFAINLQNSVEKGEYDLEIGIYGGNYKLVYFATNAKRVDKFYKLGRIKIV